MMSMKTIFSAAALALPLAASAVNPEAAPAPAQDRLAYYCPLTTGFPDRATHEQCLQESSGQALELARKFHAALFTRVGLAPEVQNFPVMVEQWDKAFGDAIATAKSRPDAEKAIATLTRDMLIIRTYHRACSESLQSYIFDPATPLNFSYTTGYNAARFCVNEAARMSRAYGLSGVDETETTRLTRHFDAIYKYYDAHPAIPAAIESTVPVPAPAAPVLSS